MRFAAGGLAVLSGLLLYAGHPPLDVGVAGLVALAPLLVALRLAGRSDHPVRDGAALGGLTGVVVFGFLLNWILRFGVVPVVLLVVIQALFVAAYGAIVAGYGERQGRGVVAVGAWAGLEALRSTFPLTGFPWGVLGATQHAGGPLLPVARVGGVILLGAVLVAISVAVEALVVTVSAWHSPAAVPDRSGRWPPWRPSRCCYRCSRRPRSPRRRPSTWPPCRATTSSCPRRWTG